MYKLHLELKLGRDQTCGNSGYPAIYSQAGTNLKISGRQFLPNSTHKVDAMKHVYTLKIMNLPAGKLSCLVQNLPTKK